MMWRALIDGVFGTPEWLPSIEEMENVERRDQTFSVLQQAVLVTT